MPEPFDTSQHDQFLRLYAQHEAALHMLVLPMLPNRGEAFGRFFGTACCPTTDWLYPSRIGQYGVFATYSPPIIPTTRMSDGFHNNDAHNYRQRLPRRLQEWRETGLTARAGVPAMRHRARENFSGKSSASRHTMVNELPVHPEPCA